MDDSLSFGVDGLFGIGVLFKVDELLALLIEMGSMTGLSMAWNLEKERIELNIGSHVSCWMDCDLPSRH